MWYLVTATGKRLHLKPNKEVTFGRKNSDILLQNDESISRLHATICVKPKDIVQNNEPISTCELKDANSKYGTYIIWSDGKTIEATNTGSTLKDGDKIRFGLQQHIFTIAYVPLITVVSTLNETEKQKLQGILDEIDGIISNEWTTACTHLTVSNAALTEKVTCAMASAVPIVNLKFWEAVQQAIAKGEKLPMAADYVPPIVESLINKGCVSLCVNEKRKTLFKNLIFVYFSVRQYKMYGRMINMAGGKSVLYSKRPLTTKEVCAPNVIVVQYSDSDTTQMTQGIVPEYETIYNSLRASKRKMISETDIPLAILYCSIEKYCNPKYRFEELLKRSQAKPDSSNVLVVDTQDLTSNLRVLPKVISNIPIRTNVNVRNPTQEIQIIPESCELTPSGSVTSQSQDRIITIMSKASQDRKNIANTDISVERGSEKRIKAIQKTSECIPETKDSYQTQDLLKTGTLKASQVTKSDISVERGPVQKIKVQKTVKCIPETKDSYETQDLLRTGSLKASQVTKSDISVERGYVQKIKAVQKPSEYIPETKDSYKTQDLLKTGTLKASQVTKSDISVERGPVQKIKVQKAVKCIPETKDSYDTQDLLSTATLKASQGAKNTPSRDIPETNNSTHTENTLRPGTSKASHISIEQASTQRLKEVCLQETVKYIPESNDLFQSQDALRSKTLNTRQIASSTSDTGISIDKRPTQRLEKVNSQRTAKCIPETNDSSDDAQNRAQCSLQRSQRVEKVEKKSRNLQEIGRMKESMIANKGTSSNEVIDLINDEDDEEEEENKLEEILLSSERNNKRCNSILSQEKLDKLVHDHSVADKSPEINRDRLPSSRENNNNSTITVSQLERESENKSRKRNKSDEFTSDDDFLTRKRLCPNNSVTEVPVVSSYSVKSSNPLMSSQPENHNSLLKNNTSSVRASANFKKFKKVHTKIPQQRITLNDMYIWNMFNVQNI